MLEKMGEFFDARLSGYEQHQLTCIDSAQEFYPFTASCLPQAYGTRILDLGCGYGDLGLRLLPLVPDGSSYTGVDMADELINKGRDIFQTTKYETKFKVA